MTLMTGQTSLQVPLVREIDKVREVVHLDPRDRFSPFPIACHLFYLRGLPFDDEVTANATLNAGNPRYGRPGSIDVTIETGDLVVSCMDLMAKGYRLFRASAGEVEDIQVITCDEGNDTDKAVQEESLHRGKTGAPFSL